LDFSVFLDGREIRELRPYLDHNGRTVAWLLGSVLDMSPVWTDDGRTLRLQRPRNFTLSRTLESLVRWLGEQASRLARWNQSPVSPSEPDAQPASDASESESEAEALNLPLPHVGRGSQREDEAHLNQEFLGSADVTGISRMVELLREEYSRRKEVGEDVDLEEVLKRLRPG